MATNNGNYQEQQESSLSGVTGNEESNEATYGSANDPTDQENYPDNGNESQTGGATDDDDILDADDNIDDDDSLTDTDDESANDADGNGGYSDAIGTNS